MTRQVSHFNTTTTDPSTLSTSTNKNIGFGIGKMFRGNILVKMLRGIAYIPETITNIFTSIYNYLGNIDPKAPDNTNSNSDTSSPTEPAPGSVNNSTNLYPPTGPAPGSADNRTNLYPPTEPAPGSADNSTNLYPPTGPAPGSVNNSTNLPPTGPAPGSVNNYPPTTNLNQPGHTKITTELNRS